MALMSQQPPYGEPQQPESQPPGQQPYAPYGPGAYPNPYAQMQQQPNHTTRNILLIVGVVVLLFCGGLVTLVFVAVNNVSDSIEDTFDDDYVGSENDPLTVTAGDAFEIRGFEYDQGWQLAPGADPTQAITGLRGTNQRDDEDSERINLTFTLVKANEEVAEIDCYSNTSVSFERSATLSCTTSATTPLGDYDTLEVYDDAFYE